MLNGRINNNPSIARAQGFSKYRPPGSVSLESLSSPSTRRHCSALQRTSWLCFVRGSVNTCHVKSGAQPQEPQGLTRAPGARGGDGGAASKVEEVVELLSTDEDDGGLASSIMGGGSKEDPTVMSVLRSF